MRVLHVTDAMGGGIIPSLLAMAEATPEVDHHLVARRRLASDTGDDWGTRFSSVHALPPDPARAVATVRRLERRLYPDLVHAHSSYAGVITRIAALDRPRVVYSPHCFAFERRDISGLQRQLFEWVERRLAPRTDLLAAVSPIEIDQATRLGHRRVAYVPNRALVGPVPRAEPRDRLHIVTVGRLTSAKDWRYFGHVKRYAEAQLGLSATWTWLGGGDPAAEQALREAGVSVSGWLARSELIERLARAQVYLHTAAWESAPISILEAAAVGLPLAVRAIESLQSLALPGQCDSVVALARELAALADPVHWAQAQAASLALTQRHCAATQGRLLREAYARALEPPYRAPVSDTDTGLWSPEVATLTRTSALRALAHRP